jgi:pimeloyl-ACP methyl ester carboxylesterase
LRWSAVILLVLLVLVYLVMPFAFGVYVVIPAHSSVGAPPAGFDEVSLQTDDGVKIAGWYAPPQDGAAIVLVPGSGDSREDVRSYAELLVKHGFGVLAIDLRGHGESGGSGNRYGWMGTHDIGAAVSFLQGRTEVKTIGGLGLSLGGEVLLGAASSYPALKALVSEGASYRTFDEYYDLSSQHPLYRNFTTRVLFFSVKLFSGDDPPLPILDSITAAESTAFLFIAAGNKRAEIDYNELFLKAVGDRGSLWVVPKAGHTQGFRRAPDEYEQRVIDFFEQALVNPS